MSTDPTPATSTSTATEVASESMGTRAAGPRRGGRRVAELGVVALAVAAIAVAGVAVLGPERDDFCGRVAELPTLATDAATPAASLHAYAAAMDRVAEAAPEDRVARAATALAAHQRALSSAIGGGASSPDLMDSVGSVDGDQLGAARSTLDEAVAARCG